MAEMSSYVELNRSNSAREDDGGSRKRKSTDILYLYLSIGFVVLILGFPVLSYYDGTIDRNMMDFNKINNGTRLEEDECIDPIELRNNAAHLQSVKCENKPNEVRVADYLNDQKAKKEFVELALLMWSFIEKILEVQIIAVLICSYGLLILFCHGAKTLIWFMYTACFVFIMNLAVIARKELDMESFAETYKPQVNEYGLPQPSYTDPSYLLLLMIMLFPSLAFICIWMILNRRKRIQLVVKLFEKPLKPLSDLRLLFILPIITYIIIIVSFATSLIMIVLSVVSSPSFKGIVMYTIMTIYIIAFLWFTQFVASCQHFIVASAVSQWYFARNKSELKHPIFKGFKNLIRFHLGTVCLGSWIIIITRMFRIPCETFLRLTGWKKSSQPGNFVLRLMCRCANFIVKKSEVCVRNAYMIVADEGTPLIHSGKRAFSLLEENLCDVVDLYHLGDFVFYVGRFFVIFFAAVTTMFLVEQANEPQMMGVTYTVWVGSVIFFFLVHYIMTVFEMTLDTMFLCFCKDLDQNKEQILPDGTSKELIDVMRELKTAAKGEFKFGPRRRQIADDGDDLKTIGNETLSDSNEIETEMENL